MFPFTELSLLHVAIAIVFSFALGALWYGPFFGKIWLSNVQKTSKVKFDKKPDNMTSLFVLALINSAVTAVFTGVFVVLTKSTSWMDALLLGVYATVAFSSPILFNEVIWEKRPFPLYLIGVGFYFVSVTGMAIIMTL